MKAPDSLSSTCPSFMFRRSIATLLFVTVWLPFAFPQTNSPFELRDGDRVVLLGDTFIEREESYGHIEFLLTTQFPDRKVTFRNLGWSADTPLGVSRAGFDPADKGFERLKEQLAAIKPTVAFLGYGMANSFDGEAAAPKFRADLEKLMDTIQQISAPTNQVRFVLLGPILHEKLSPPLPDPSKQNEQLKLYTQVIQEIAQKRQAVFVPFFDLLNGANYNRSFPPATDDGVHLTDYGYRRAAEALGEALRWNMRFWRLGITGDGQPRKGSSGIQVLELEHKPDRVRLLAVEDRLPCPPWPQDEKARPLFTPDSRLQFIIRPGQYEYRVDGKLIRSVTDKDCLRGLEITSGPSKDQSEELRQAITKKNELFFHRWRPENN